MSDKIFVRITRGPDLQATVDAEAAKGSAMANIEAVGNGCWMLTFIPSEEDMEQTILASPFSGDRWQEGLEQDLNDFLGENLEEGRTLTQLEYYPTNEAALVVFRKAPELENTPIAKLLAELQRQSLQGSEDEY